MISFFFSFMRREFWLVKYQMIVIMIDGYNNNDWSGAEVLLLRQDAERRGYKRRCEGHERNRGDAMIYND